LKGVIDTGLGNASSLSRYALCPHFFVQARESAGLSLDEVASRSGIDKAQLSRLENGKVHDPRSSTRARYARAIGKRLAWSLEHVQLRQPR
jgi:transcriptional regulator with XRE-family HTH domain